MSTTENTTDGPQLSAYVRQAIPNSEICNTALKLAWQALPEAIFNHSLRVFLIAQWLARKENDAEWTTPSDDQKVDTLFVACICHDLGASDQYNGKQRFEVEGADAAKAHLLSHGVSEPQSHQAWIAVAVHSSPGIAERIAPLSRLVRYGVKMDFSAAAQRDMGALGFCAEIESHLPRLSAEKVLGDAVVGQAGKNDDGRVDGLTWQTSDKHPCGSWPGVLLRAHRENPGYDGVNPAF